MNWCGLMMGWCGRYEVVSCDASGRCDLVWCDASRDGVISVKR